MRASGGMVDALASGASASNGMEVRVFSRVPYRIDGFYRLFYLCKLSRLLQKEKPLVLYAIMR